MMGASGKEPRKDGFEHPYKTFHVFRKTHD